MPNKRSTVLVPINGVTCHNAELLQQELQKPAYDFKALINEKEISFFPRTVLHREHKVGTLSYEEESQGNALAVCLTRNLFAIRHHERYSPEHVRLILNKLLQHPDLAPLKTFQVTYGGKPLP